MPDFTFTPTLPVKPTEADFIQRIELIREGTIIGSLVWATGNGRHGVVQLISLSIDPKSRRQGAGRRLYEAALGQIRGLHALRKAPVRRVWCSVEQKTQVVARAFLTGLGFHHVGTVENLLRDEDALIYVKSYD